MSDLNLRYDYIIEAAHFNDVIRRMRLQPQNISDEVEMMMWKWMFKQLEQVRDSLLAQGLNGIVPGHGEGQTNPVSVANALVNKALGDK